MIILELFAGSRSIGKAAEAAGHTVISCDIEQFGDIDIVGDILEIPISKYLMYPIECIWASPPCTTFSVASMGTHWNENREPKTEAAVKGLKILDKTLEIIKVVNPKYWYIENPRGMMRKMEQMKGLNRTTIWYCKYGDTRAKPTDIWSNNIANLFNQDGWLPRAECFNGNKKCHHESAPRSQTVRKMKSKGITIKIGGTQALKNNHERSKIPEKLCAEIIESIK